MTDFGTVSPGIRPAEHRNKDADALKARMDAIPACLTAWAAKLPVQSLEALAVVERANKAAGGACIVRRSDIASAIGVTHDGAERILARLVEVGAVERFGRMMQEPVFKVVPTPPASPIAFARQKEAPAPMPARKTTGTTDPRLKANLVGLRAHGEPEKTNLMAGVLDARR